MWLSGVAADADFLDVRTRLEKNHSGNKGDAVDKYFRMLRNDIEHCRCAY
jgi:hypothetical protein